MLKDENKVGEVVEKEEKIPAWAKTLMDQNKELSEKVKMFEEMTGKNAIASYNDKKKDFTASTATLREFNGKVIIEWSNLDYSKFNPNAKDGLGENILVELTYLDGSKETINVIALERSKKMVDVLILKKKDDNCLIELPPNIVAKYELKEKNIIINNKFLNR